MQTLANMSGSKDVQRQVDLNQVTMARISDYYNRFKSTLQYQLTKISAFHINIMSSNQTAVPASAKSSMENKILNAPKKVLQAMDKYDSIL